MIVWLASYPRSGNTLLRLMLKQAFGVSSFSKYNDHEDIGKNPSVAEKVGHEFWAGEWKEVCAEFSTNEEQIYVKTHDSPDDESRAIYVVREGRRACISYWHYLNDYYDPSVSLESVIVGSAGRFPSWGSHLDAWMPSSRPNTLLLKYEDLLGAPQQQLDKIAAFCAIEQHNEWSNEFSSLQDIEPKFFRGSVTAKIAELNSDQEELFSTIHGDWIERLGYGDGEKINACPYLRKYFLPSKLLEERGYKAAKREFSDVQAAERDRQRQKYDELAMRSEKQVAELEERLHRQSIERERFDALAEDREQPASQSTAAKQKKAGLLSQISSLEQELMAAKQESLALRSEYEDLSRRYSTLLEMREKPGLGVLLYRRFYERYRRIFRFLPGDLDLNSLERKTVVPRMTNVTAKRPTRNFRDFFEHVKRLDFYPKTVIDVGVARGTPPLYEAFPDAYLLLFEPVLDFVPHLEAILKKYKGEYHNCALMSASGTSTIFKTKELHGSSMMHRIVGDNDSRLQAVDVKTLDEVVGDSRKGPILLKTDCQGGDFDVVKGGVKTLKQCELVILEVSFFKFWGNHHPDPLEIITFMSEQGFVLYDFLDGLFRPRDEALGQIDMVFVKRDGMFRTSHKWGKD